MRGKEWLNWLQSFCQKLLAQSKVAQYAQRAERKELLAQNSMSSRNILKKWSLSKDIFPSFLFTFLCHSSFLNKHMPYYFFWVNNTYLEYFTFILHLIYQALSFALFHFVTGSTLFKAGKEWLWSQQVKQSLETS